MKLMQINSCLPQILFSIGLIISCNGSASNPSGVPPHSPAVVTEVPSSLTLEQLQTQAEASSVRIFSHDQNPAGGSGVLIGRRESGQNDRYLVVTNQHVIGDADREYYIETHDEKIYKAEMLPIQASEPPEDICFVSFSSPLVYSALPFQKSQTPISVTQKVFAGGFPFLNERQSRKFEFTEGSIRKILDRPFVGGYQVGYTNEIIPGMSGGPVLNGQGELISINGLRSYPIVDNAYVYEDGTASEEISIVRELSWSIPIETAIRLFETADPNHSVSASPPIKSIAPETPTPSPSKAPEVPETPESLVSCQR